MGGSRILWVSKYGMLLDTVLGVGRLPASIVTPVCHDEFYANNNCDMVDFSQYIFS